MNTFQNAAIVLVFALIGPGCASHKFTRLEQVRDNEAVAVAKIRLVNKGKDVTKGSTILFNAPMTGIVKYACQPEPDGYIFIRLPVGDNCLNQIIHPNGLTQHRFGNRELTFQLPESKGIYYLGDITLDWQGTAAAGNWMLATAIGGIPGILAGGAVGQGRIVANVESNEAQAQEALKRKFLTDRAATPALLAVNPQPPKKSKK